MFFLTLGLFIPSNKLRLEKEVTPLLKLEFPTTSQPPKPPNDVKP